MKWRSTNIWYLAGIGIPFVVIAALCVKIALPTIWICIVIIAIAALLLKGLISKTLSLPKPESAYANIQPLSLTLPCDYGVELYTSDSLCEYDFVLRIAELLSPFSFGGRPPKVIVNPKLLEQKGELFMEMSIVREIERNRKNDQLYTILHLILPIFVLVAGILSVFAFDLQASNYLSPFMFQLALPFLCTIAFAAHILTWNQSLSKKDFKLDSYLASIYPLDDVKEYILTVEELERRLDKEKVGQFNAHYASVRVKRLEQKVK